jgi:micrococcal nuclease
VTAAGARRRRGAWRSTGSDLATARWWVGQRVAGALYPFSDVDGRLPWRDSQLMRDALALAMVLVAAAPTFAWTEPALTLEAAVVHVDDGDTIDVWIDGRRERVRYIGIDAPEIAHDGVGGERGGEAATRLNLALLRGRRVRLEFDRERRDRYGRLLAYVWVGDVMINVELVRRGYARALAIPPNVRHGEWFARAQAGAQAAHLGLWGQDDLDDPAITPSRRALPRLRGPRAFRPFFPRRAGITMTHPCPAWCSPARDRGVPGEQHGSRSCRPTRTAANRWVLRPVHNRIRLNAAWTWGRHAGPPTRSAR